MIRAAMAAWILMWAGVALWGASMWLDDEPPYEWSATESRIIPNPAPQNAMVTADWKLDKVNRVCPGSVQRFFYDRDTRRTAATLDTTPVSRAVQVGDQRLPRAFELPPRLPPRVSYQAEVCFQCNILQRFFPFCIRTPAIDFDMQAAK